MIYFFYGENDYLIKKEANDFQKRLSGQGNIDLTKFDGSTLTREAFLSSVLSTPFLSDKRVVIIKNFLLDNKDNDLKKFVQNKLEKIPETTELLFVESGIPDSRTSLFKKLSILKNAKNFGKTSNLVFSNMIEEKVNEAEIKISPTAKNKLQIFIGDDLMRLEFELDKLILYRKALSRKGSDEIICDDDIDKLVDPINNPNIFDFIEFVAKKNTKNAVKALFDLIKNGEAEVKILAMIVYQFRTMLIVQDLLNSKLSAVEIAKKARIHPFVVQKTLFLLKNYPEKILEKNYDLLKKTDSDIKNGILESKLALELLVIELCR